MKRECLGRNLFQLYVFSQKWNSKKPNYFLTVLLEPFLWSIKCRILKKWQVKVNKWFKRKWKELRQAPRQTSLLQKQFLQKKLIYGLGRWTPMRNFKETKLRTVSFLWLFYLSAKITNHALQSCATETSSRSLTKLADQGFSMGNSLKVN